MRSNTLNTLALGLSVLTAPTDAFWRMRCPGRVVRERADPIVTPGQVAGHLHTISGGSGFGFSMDYAQARTSSCSSCTIKDDFSNYWTPQLFFRAGNGSFIPVPVVGDGDDTTGGMTVYYLQRGDAGEKLQAFPKDFRMLAGDPAKRNFTGGLDAQAISFACLGANKPETNGLPDYNCPGGLRAQVFFPSCWDGKNLDSDDHRSHMSYPANSYNSGKCPPSHPVHLISIFFEILYDTSRFANEWTGGKQPFVFANGDDTGFGLHGDFVNGWNIDLLQSAVNDCTADSGKVEDCQHFQQYTDAECKACRVPSLVDEQTDGWLSALPGCNPVTSGPAPAQRVTGCGAPTSLGQAETFFTDVTVTKKWEYVGCGTDEYGSRTLTGKSTSSDTMTVESCIDFCKSNGFSYAGLEYGRECYCDNSVPADRAPVPGIMGSCQMKCAGDSGEYCGDAAALSIYHACGSTCQNAQYGVVGNSTTPAAPAESSAAPAVSSPAAAASSAAASSPVASPVESSTLTTSTRTRSSPTKTAAASSVQAADATPTSPANADAGVPGGYGDHDAATPETTTIAANPTATPSGFDPEEWDCGEEEEI